VKGFKAGRKKHQEVKCVHLAKENNGGGQKEVSWGRLAIKAPPREGRHTMATVSDDSI
jgi:hypothetical protein